MPSIHSFTVLPSLPETLKNLEAIAHNMFWAWNHDFIALFKRIDSNLWYACGQNPIKLLSNISQKRLEQLANNPGFLNELGRAYEKLNSYLQASTWYQSLQIGEGKPTIAYFCAEFGIHQCLPVYSGGLGILAGDHLKSASDLGIPLVGVGLMYQKGYFRQYLNIDGWQQEAYIENDFYHMPVELIRDSNAEPIYISVDLEDRKVYVQIWAVSVGRIKLYLLDTNIPVNPYNDRLITSVLYGGDNDMRIRQEIVLGIGGLRALDVLGIKPTVCHMNEGHAAFLALERIRILKNALNLNFDEALEATRAGNVFTVHTPVKAGLDEFPIEMMDKYLSNYYSQLNISRDNFLALGRFNPYDEKEGFKMPVLAIKTSSFRNGVSKLHGDVSRKMWSALWPGIPDSEVPITSVTNGVHIKTWLSDEMNALYERYLGANWTDESTDPLIWNNIDYVPDEEFWRTHQRCKIQLISFVRERLKAQLQRRGTYHTELNWAEEVLDPEALTIGFSRRFATYKRGNLLLKDAARLVKILNNTDRPVQIIFSGKAHPRDTEGKEIIRQIIHFAAKYDVRRRIVFLEDYDMNIASKLVRGVDIWLNTPRPPMEASGTSGMKAAINGALNMSTLDGWWCEGYKPEGGWIIGAGEHYDDSAYQDMVESQAIYNVLEREVVPLFYTRSNDNLPRAWIKRIKNSIKWIAGQFNTHRMVMEYTERFYNPAQKRWQYLSENSIQRAKNLSQWKENIRSVWQHFSVKDVKVEVGSNGNGGNGALKSYLKVGTRLNIKAVVHLGRINPSDVSIELYHGTLNPWDEICDGANLRMNFKENCGNDGDFVFEGDLECKSSGRQGFSVRILPNHPDLITPYDMSLITWESQNSASNN